MMPLVRLSGVYRIHFNVYRMHNYCGYANTKEWAVNVHVQGCARGTSRESWQQLPFASLEAESKPRSVFRTKMERQNSIVDDLH